MFAKTDTQTMPTTPKLIRDIKAARRAAIPIVAITTPDQSATIDAVANDALKLPSGGELPILKWDVVTGIAPVNEQGKTLLKVLRKEDSEMSWQDPRDMLIVAQSFPANTVIFMINAHLFIKDPTVTQAVWNLRDTYKVNKRILIMLAPAMTLPPELEPDVIVLDEPLPSASELEAIIIAQYENANLKKPDADLLFRAVDAITGLPAFTAEQVTAMSLSKDGLDVGALWERKRQAIEATPGLAVWRGKESFEDIGGCRNAKDFVAALLHGEQPPRCVVFMDEIEKALAGATAGDTSGTSADQLGQILSYMEDHQSDGLIFIGPPGSAKSAIAKAAGNAAEIPTITLDLGGMKGSLVGESEQHIRAALKVVTAVGSNNVLFIATCNSLASLPPELRRRFTMGTFFFDLPTKDERAEIWSIWLKKFNLKDQARPDDAKWTGAEIKQCCKIAYKLKTTLVKAAMYVVPVARSAAEQIEALRKSADGRFISASKEGFFELEKKPEQEIRTPSARMARAIES